MATADFETFFVLRGTAQENRALVDVIKRYDEGVNGAYFSFFHMRVDGVTYHLDSIGENVLRAALANGSPVEISANGPYGSYMELNDVDIFRDMAKAAPGASFEANIEGFASYSEQSLDCELKDGVLHISTFYMDNDEGPEAYTQYFTDLLPFDDFVLLFEMDPETFDEDLYRDFISDCFMCEEDLRLDRMDYESFFEYHTEDLCALDEESFEQAIEKIRPLDIMSYEDFIDDADCGFRQELDYDPVADKYITPEADEAAEAAARAEAAAIAAVIAELEAAEEDAPETAGDISEAETPEESEPVGEAAETEIVREAEAEPEDVPAETAGTPAADPEPAPAAPKVKKAGKAWLVWLIVIALLAGALTAGYFLCPSVSEFINSLPGYFG